MFLAENLKNTAKREHRIWPVKCKWAKPKPLYKQKEQTGKTKNLVCLLFFLLVMFLLTHKWCYATHNDVARKCSQWCDVCPLCRRHNIIHAVNITAEGNITCPQGKHRLAWYSVKSITLMPAARGLACVFGDGRGVYSSVSATLSVPTYKT